MNPFVGLDPLSINRFIEIAILYWPAFLMLAVVVVITSRSSWLLRHRPLQRFDIRDYRSSLWSLPILVWAFETSFFTHNWYRSAWLYNVGSFAFFVEIFLLEAFLTLCVLVALQLVAALLIERGRLGLGAAGHFRVAMIYALIAVVLDGFLLLSVLIGNWPDRTG